MKYGIVKYFDLAKGYGLIATEDGREEIVVQQSEVDRARLGQLAANQRLGFDIAACALGPSAINLWATFGNR
jgi:CspA family cold shock protein